MIPNINAEIGVSESAAATSGVQRGGNLTVYDYSGRPPGDNPLPGSQAWIPWAVGAVVVIAIGLVAVAWLKGGRR